MINGSRLYNGDREITSRMKIKDITTEVFRSNENPEREYCLDWCTASESSIKGHQQWKWGRPHVNDEEGIRNTKEVNTVCCEGIQ